MEKRNEITDMDVCRWDIRRKSEWFNSPHFHAPKGWSTKKLKEMIEYMANACKLSPDEIIELEEIAGLKSDK